MARNILEAQAERGLRGRPAKSSVASIYLRRLDGRRDELGLQMHDSWAQANDALDAMAKTAPVTSVHEVDFSITWETGAEYAGTLSLTYHPRGGYDLAGRIRYHIEVVAGARCPKHLSELDYTVALGKVAAADRKYWADFVQAHELGTAKAAAKAEAKIDAAEVLSWLHVEENLTGTEAPKETSNA